MIENIVFDYGGVLVQYDFVAFFGQLLGSRERGQWFMVTIQFRPSCNQTKNPEVIPGIFCIGMAEVV